MREHEVKSNYTRIAILILSFVIVVVTMIPALQIFKGKRIWPDNPFQYKNLKDLNIYTYTHTYSYTSLILGEYFHCLISAAHVVKKKYYSWGQGHEFKFQEVKRILQGKEFCFEAMDCLLNLSPPCSISIIVYVKSSELRVSCKLITGTGWPSSQDGIGESPAFSLHVKSQAPQMIFMLSLLSKIKEKLKNKFYFCG